VQTMEQLKARRPSLTPTPAGPAVKAGKRMSAFLTGGGPGGLNLLGLGGGGGGLEEKNPAFTLPTINKPHLFALKNSERELWLHAENAETRLEWVQAIRGIQKRKQAAMQPQPLPQATLQPAPGSEAAAAAAAATPRVAGGGGGAKAGAGASIIPEGDEEKDADGSAAAATAAVSAPEPSPAAVAAANAASSGPSWEVPFHAVSVLSQVGVGAFGAVFRARLWGTEVAMKTLKTEQFASSDALRDELKKEVSILSALRHPNVVLYIGACTIPPNLAIVTEVGLATAVAFCTARLFDRARAVSGCCVLG